MHRSKYDWPRIILRLRPYFSYEDIAGHRELDASTVRQWVSRDTCPRYDDGEWLIAMFKLYVSEEIPLRKENAMTQAPARAGGEGHAALVGSLAEDSAGARAPSASSEAT